MNHFGGINIGSPTLSTHKPGWTLTQEFDLDLAVADLQATTQRLAEMAQDDDGSQAHTAAIEALRGTGAQISARITRQLRA